MAVAFNAGTAPQIATLVDEVQWNHNASGSNRLARVGIAFATNGGELESVTYGGIAMTLRGAALHASAFLQVAMLELVAPPTGEQLIVATFSQPIVSIIASSQSYTGVNQSTPSDTAQVTNNGAGGTASKSVSSNAGDMVTDVICLDFSNINREAAEGQTERFSDKEESNGYSGAGSDRPGDTTPVTMAWTFDASVGFCHVAANIRAASSSSGLLLKLMQYGS
jgi:hypothetical protein